MKKFSSFLLFEDFCINGLRFNKDAPLVVLKRGLSYNITWGNRTCLERTHLKDGMPCMSHCLQFANTRLTSCLESLILSTEGMFDSAGAIFFETWACVCLSTNLFRHMLASRSLCTNAGPYKWSSYLFFCSEMQLFVIENLRKLRVLYHSFWFSLSSWTNFLQFFDSPSNVGLSLLQNVYWFE